MASCGAHLQLWDKLHELGKALSRCCWGSGEEHTEAEGVVATTTKKKEKKEKRNIHRKGKQTTDSHKNGK